MVGLCRRDLAAIKERGQGDNAAHELPWQLAGWASQRRAEF